MLPHLEPGAEPHPGHAYAYDLLAMAQVNLVEQIADGVRWARNSWLAAGGATRVLRPAAAVQQTRAVDKHDSSATRMSEASLVWHYTTLEILQMILESGTLLATEVGYQNDSREPETANEAIGEALQSLLHDALYERFARSALAWLRTYRNSFGFLGENVGSLVSDSRFIFCASTDPDNLYAWRTYAGGSRTGCAIGLDPETPLSLIASSPQSPTISGWTKVIYEREDLLRFAVEKLRHLGDAWNSDMAAYDDGSGVLISDLAATRAEIAAVAKHGSFRDERETRLTVSDASGAVVFTSGASGPRPRVRLAAAEKWGGSTAEPQARLPIRAVILAPDAREQAVTTAQWLLYANGYPLDPEYDVDEAGAEPVLYKNHANVVTITRSKHPYRQV